MPSFSTQFEPPKIIQVKAYLDNRCSVTNDAFVAEAPEQGRTAKFRDGVAIMRLPENAKIRLAVSRAFPAFTYEDTPQDVAPIVTLNCRLFGFAQIAVNLWVDERTFPTAIMAGRFDHITLAARKAATASAHQDLPILA